jgi:hypothetical protein
VVLTSPPQKRRKRRKGGKKRRREVREMFFFLEVTHQYPKVSILPPTQFKVTASKTGGGGEMKILKTALPAQLRILQKSPALQLPGSQRGFISELPTLPQCSGG